MKLPRFPVVCFRRITAHLRPRREVRQIMAAVTATEESRLRAAGTPVITEMVWKRTLPGVSGIATCVFDTLLDRYNHYGFTECYL